MNKQLELFNTRIYNKNIDKKSWDIMVEYTCYFLTLLFGLAVITIVLMMIQNVT
mgnify:CR=1 FL=1